jgi:hypothetical protein
MAEGSVMDGFCGGTGGVGDEFTAVAAQTSTRRAFVRRGGVLGAVALAGGAFAAWDAGTAPAAPSQALDLKIFNFALLLEYLQAAFYTEAQQRLRLRGEMRDYVETVGGHEREHVAYLRKALGKQARPRPVFHFGQATSNRRKFLNAAVLLENTGVAAYNGQAANLTKPSLSAAVEIVSVEGRHAAWISDLAGRAPAPRAADPGESAQQVTAALRATGFIKT